MSWGGGGSNPPTIALQLIIPPVIYWSICRRRGQRFVLEAPGPRTRAWTEGGGALGCEELLRVQINIKCGFLKFLKLKIRLLFIIPSPFAVYHPFPLCCFQSSCSSQMCSRRACFVWGFFFLIVWPNLTNLRVLSANRVDFGLFLFYNFSNFFPPPPRSEWSTSGLAHAPMFPTSIPVRFIRLLWVVLVFKKLHMIYAGFEIPSLFLLHKFFNFIPPPPITSFVSLFPFVHWNDGMRCCKSDWPGLFFFFVFFFVKKGLFWPFFFFFYIFRFSPPPPPQKPQPRRSRKEARA